ncbi:Hypothetical protein, putative, partial [Bodo saltans]
MLTVHWSEAHSFFVKGIHRSWDKSACVPYLFLRCDQRYLLLPPLLSPTLSRANGETSSPNSSFCAKRKNYCS